MDIRFTINNKEIEIDGSIIAPLTYSIADVKDPTKRTRNRSKTIKIKGTQNNNATMYAAYSLSLDDVNSVGFDFDPNAESTAKIYRNSHLVFEGVANLIDVEIKDKVKYFNVQIFGNSVGLFDKIGDSSLANLGWSEYDHTLNMTNIENSWATSVVVDGTPTVNFSGSSPLGFGYLYALVNYGYAVNQLSPKTNEILPLFYIRETLQKIFALGGYTISGNWINQNLIRRLVYGLGGGERPSIGGVEVAARLVHYTSDAAARVITVPPFNSINIGGIIQFFRYYFAIQFSHKMSDISPFTTTLVNDTRTQFDEANGITTIGSSGTYNLEATLNLSVTFFDFTLSGANEAKAARYELQIRRNGIVIGSQVRNENAAGTGVLEVKVQSILEAGDEVEVYFLGGVFAFQENPFFFPVGKFTINYKTTDANSFFKIEALNQSVVDGDTMYMANFLPEMSCRKFVSDMITMFNLYFSEPNENNEIEIESFNDYYDDTDEAENWSNILDISKVQKISSNAGIDGKNYLFRWAEDRDMYKSIYFNEFGVDYGDLNYKIKTTFKKGDKVFQVGFAQSVPIDVGGLVIPQIVKRDEQTNLQVSHKGKPRIYIYNGLETGGFDLINSSTGAVTSFTSYPQVHHVDDVAAPTFDLNFGIPKKIYYTTSEYTTNNLFSENYDRYIKELTSSDSKFFIASFNINETHLQGQHMKRLANVDGVVFRKNIITDFDATGYETTRVELVKVLEAKQRATRMNLSGLGVVRETSSNRVISPITNVSDAFYSVNRTDGSFIEVDSSAEAITIELADDNYFGAEITIKRIGANTVTVQAETGQIDGNDTLDLTSNYEYMTFIYTSTGWKRI